MMMCCLCAVFFFFLHLFYLHFTQHSKLFRIRVVCCMLSWAHMLPFLVMRGVFFCHLMKTNDPYILLSHTFFSSQVIPDFYEKTHKAIEETLTKSLEPWIHHR